MNNFDQPKGLMCCLFLLWYCTRRFSNKILMTLGPISKLALWHTRGSYGRIKVCLPGEVCIDKSPLLAPLPDALPLVSHLLTSFILCRVRSSDTFSP